ncbi:MAG: flippase-like domain-containing protein [Anaerolineae bacterium]|nr:flippase-like domain-containing protein [Anaerolineae bacterium]
MRQQQNLFTDNLLRWLPGVVISLGAIVFLLFWVDWVSFGEALAMFRITSILILFLVAMVAMLFRSLAWQMLLNREVKLIDCYLLESVGYLLNNFLPLRLGELGRSILMGQQTRRGTMYTLSSVGIERTMDMGFAALTLLISLPLLSNVGWSSLTPVYTIAVVSVVLGTIYIISRKQVQVEAWLGRFTATKPWFSKTLYPLMVSLVQGTTVFARGRVLLLTTTYLMLAWLGYYLNFYIVIRTIAPEAPFWWALVVNGIVSLGIAIPSAPGSIGVWEASFVAGLALFGINEGHGIAAAVVLHLMNYLLTGVLGLIGLARFGSSFSAIFRELSFRKKEIETNG